MISGSQSVLGRQIHAESFLIKGSTVRLSVMAHGQAMKKLCSQIGGHSGLNPIL
ncbi:hypothetical protein VCR26J2_370154 [Vibrio coralliirubri]|nr:hypothetical protein VCR26J2_370154 [Vibrio coralliirubri]